MADYVFMLTSTYLFLAFNLQQDMNIFFVVNIIQSDADADGDGDEENRGWSAKCV